MTDKDIAYNTKGYKVLTPNGYMDFAGVAYMGDKPIVRLEFDDGRDLECTALHRLFDADGNAVTVDLLEIGSEVLIRNGSILKVTSIKQTDRVEPVYDLVDVKGGHRYYTNGILSHNCEFVSDDETLIDSLVLSTLRNREPEFYTGQVRWFQDPEPNRSFLIGLDPSLGTGGDYAAIQVFQVPEMIQVAEWQHNKTAPRGQIKILMQILYTLQQSLLDDPDQNGAPEIYWSVENNSIGEAVLQIIEDTGEHNFPGFFVSEKRTGGSGRGRFRKGLNTSNSKKLSACAKLKSLMESNRMKVNSQTLIRQFKNFVSNGASYAAKSGEHDDLVSATLLVVRILDAIIGWLKEEDSNELKEMVSPEDDDATPLPIM